MTLDSCRKTITVAAVGVALVTLQTFSVAAPAQAQEVTLRMHTFIPPVANPAKTFLIPWAKKIGEASKGRIKVQPFWAMQLGGKAPQLLGQVRDGVVDIIWTLPGFTSGVMPRSEVFELPFVHKEPVSTTLALQDFQQKHLMNTELSHYHPLLLHVHEGFMFMTRKPIQKMADLKNVKIRAASRVGVWLLEALGATGLGLPLPRIPSALSKGVIDGVLLTYEIVPAVKVPELVSHYSTLSGPQPRLGTSVFAFLMNKASYNKLPSDLKKVIDDNSGRKIARATGENWRAIEGPGLAAVKALKKNKFYKIAPDEVAKIRKAAMPVFDRWLNEMKGQGIDGTALLKDARALIDKYSK